MWLGTIEKVGTIPPQSTYFSASECRLQLRPGCDSVQIAASIPHTHIAGVAIWSELYNSNDAGDLSYVRSLPCPATWPQSWYTYPCTPDPSVSHMHMCTRLHTCMVAACHIMMHQRPPGFRLCTLLSVGNGLGYISFEHLLHTQACHQMLMHLRCTAMFLHLRTCFGELSSSSELRLVIPADCPVSNCTAQHCTSLLCTCSIGDFLVLLRIEYANKLSPEQS